MQNYFFIGYRHQGIFLIEDGRQKTEVRSQIGMECWSSGILE